MDWLSRERIRDYAMSLIESGRFSPVQILLKADIHGSILLDLAVRAVCGKVRPLRETDCLTNRRLLSEVLEIPMERSAYSVAALPGLG